jgi:hypothetical protein
VILTIVRPAPPALRGQACSQCKKLQASWDLPLKGKDSVPICSLCVLYDPTVWCDSTKTTIAEIEAAKGKMFERDLSAQLTSAKDADDVIGVLALSARVRRLSPA